MSFANIPVGKKYSYFFAYHLVNGQPFAFMWVEDEKLPVGGIPNPVPGTIVEITPAEYRGGISELEKEHPYSAVEELPSFLTSKLV